MTNEIIFIVTTLICLTSALIAFSLGKQWITAYVVMASAVLGCVSAKISVVFGLPVTLGDAIYVSLYLASDMVTERYGKKEGFRLIQIGFVSLFLFTALTQLALLMQAEDYAANISSSMDTVFNLSLRITLGGALAYIISQHFDVWLYDKINSWTKERFLWLRNNGSTIISQGLDSAIFYFIAFYGVMPNLLNIALAGYLIKVTIALCDTPFIYLSKKIKKVRS